MFSPGCSNCGCPGSGSSGSGLSGSSGGGSSGSSGSGSGSGSGSSGSGPPPHTIFCASNPGELMLASLNAKATVCGTETTLPNLVYQDLGNGTSAWTWFATDVPPVVDRVAINGCLDSNPPAHTLCFNDTTLFCGPAPGDWGVLSLGMFNFQGLFSPKGSLDYEIISPSPLSETFHIRYTFSVDYSYDISGAGTNGCCNFNGDQIIVDVWEPS